MITSTGWEGLKRCEIDREHCIELCGDSIILCCDGNTSEVDIDWDTAEEIIKILKEGLDRKRVPR